MGKHQGGLSGDQLSRSLPPQGRRALLSDPGSVKGRTFLLSSWSPLRKGSSLKEGVGDLWLT